MAFKFLGITIDDTPFCGPVCECQRRCKSWFGQTPDVERQCRKACHEDKHFTREEFLCEGNWVDEMAFIAAYGYDPCPDNDTTITDFLDPLNDRERQDKQLEEYTPFIIGGGALLLIVLIIFAAIALK